VYGSYKETLPKEVLLKGKAKAADGEEPVAPLTTTIRSLLWSETYMFPAPSSTMPFTQLFGPSPLSALKSIVVGSPPLAGILYTKPFEQLAR
jgi:hypothetical protein